jgi:ribonucleotide reductase alpha subunit
MKRVHNNEVWSLFSADDCPGLDNMYGDEFEELYKSYETLGKYRSQLNARDLWFKILDSQMETGTPYLLYKDSVNKKTNQQHLGTIKSSNLCCEIMEYSDNKETAVCNLASIGLPTFVNKENKTFDYNKLHDVVKVIVHNLNNIIDVNFYPTEKTKRSNMLHRPIGIGIQGLADVFIMMDLAFESDAAKEINEHIFETIYHASLEKSNEIAIDRLFIMSKIKRYIYTINHLLLSDVLSDDMYKEIPIQHYKEVLEREDTSNINMMYFKPTFAEIINLEHDCCGAHSSFIGSPLSKGKLQFDLWDFNQNNNLYDWDALRHSIQHHGVRNSLLVAPMPTASTSQILGFNECFEPITSNIYTRRTLAGEFIVINKYLLRELTEMNVWNDDIKENIIKNKGSIQQLTGLSQHIKDKYKTVWEIKMKNVIQMSADRGKYICQSQSLNLWVEDPTYSKLTSMHFYSWNKGLKTGIYYLRRKARHQPQQFTIEPETKKITCNKINNEDDVCEFCSA